MEGYWFFLVGANHSVSTLCLLICFPVFLWWISFSSTVTMTLRKLSPSVWSFLNTNVRIYSLVSICSLERCSVHNFAHILLTWRLSWLMVCTPAVLLFSIEMRSLILILLLSGLSLFARTKMASLITVVTHGFHGSLSRLCLNFSSTLYCLNTDEQNRHDSVNVFDASGKFYYYSHLCRNIW